MPKLHEALIECDAYVLGTPTFYGDIPGSFKTFVDRVYPFVAIGKDPVTKTMTFGSNMPRRKPGVQICVSGNHGAKVFDSHLKVGYFCFNDLNAYPWEEILIPNTSWVAVKDNEEKLQELSAMMISKVLKEKRDWILPMYVSQIMMRQFRTNW